MLQELGATFAPGFRSVAIYVQGRPKTCVCWTVTGWWVVPVRAQARGA